MRTFECALVGAALFAAIGIGSAGAQVLLRVPEDSPGIPAYARVGQPTLHNDDWAAIVFYRDPACVPAGFNLLGMFDVPAAFGCTLMVSGIEVWDNGPGIDLGPRHAVSNGAEVAIWFVPWPVLQAALADDVLTMSELGALAPLKGTAKRFHETLGPLGVAKVPHLAIAASGVLDDGRSFDFEYTEVVGRKPPPTVRIAFR